MMACTCRLPTIFAAEQRSNSDARRMTLESLWTLEIGVSGAYGKVLFNNEELAKKLSGSLVLLIREFKILINNQGV